MQQDQSNEMNQDIKASSALKVILGGTILYFGVILSFAQMFSSMF